MLGRSMSAKKFADAIQAHRDGDLDTAERLYRAILRAEPKHFDATQLLGAVLLVRGRHKEAGQLLRRAIAFNPNVAAVHNNLGNVLRDEGMAQEAVASYDRAVALDPAAADAYNNRGNALGDLNRFAEALADYERALERNPLQRNALQRSAKLLADIGRFDEALARNARALGAGAPSLEVYRRSGNVFLQVGRPAEALAEFDKALVLAPGDVQSIVARSAALEALGRSADAMAALDEALMNAPDDPATIASRAKVLGSLERLDEACAAYASALALAPADGDIKANYAMALLSKGDFAAGWPLYEYRWARKGGFARPPALAFPQWTGEALDGRSILVFAEQGLGDTVQFARYLPLLRERGAAVGFLAPARLHAILRAAFPTVPLFAEVGQVPPHDFQCALMSLPLHLGTRLDSIPAGAPYLKADPERVALWRARLGAQGPRIGLCWQGSPTAHVDPGRSIALAQFAPLAAVPGVRLISLQKSDMAARIANAGFAVETLDADLDAGPDAFVDTLAVMESLDLVVSCDTSVAHVAGALGRPVWTALKFSPDWRWLRGREDSPWYPTMRLFRQHAPGDWAGVFARMAAALAG
jgi:tetratricopeptide (TPR) repeat protein